MKKEKTDDKNAKAAEPKPEHVEKLKGLIQSHSWDQIKWWIETHGQIPQDLVQQSYMDALKRLDTISVEKLWDITHEKLDCDHDTAMQLYKRIMAGGYPFGALCFRRITGIPIERDEDFIRECYRTYLGGGQVEAIFELDKVTGIPPKFSKTALQITVDSLASKGHIPDIARLYQTLHVWTQPSLEALLLGYERIIESGRMDMEYNLSKAHQLTGIPVPPEMIQKYYDKFVNEQEFREANSLRRGTHVPPSPEIMEKYKKKFANRSILLMRSLERVESGTYEYMIPHNR